MSVDPFVGTYLVAMDETSSTRPIGSGVEVKIEKPDGDYRITSNSSEMTWQSLVGHPDGENIQGALPLGASFEIERVPDHAQIKCTYGGIKDAETGSWTADDEGADKDL